MYIKDRLVEKGTYTKSCLGDLINSVHGSPRVWALTLAGRVVLGTVVCVHTDPVSLF